jgi:uncharacterized membrane protein YvbJ
VTHCAKCGAENSDGIFFCTQCGAKIGTAAGSPPAPNYSTNGTTVVKPSVDTGPATILAVIATLLCFPLGIVAGFQLRKANRADTDEIARQRLSIAKTLSVLGIGLFVLFIMIMTNT